MTISKQIRVQIEAAPLGSVFTVSDFADLSNHDTARKSLSRLEEEGIIKKVIRGIYYKPKFSTLLKEEVAPDINDIAEAIARNFEWSIVPSGENALNQLGISTQVPGRYSYISSGPYRDYIIGNTKIEFIHRADKDLNGKNDKTKLVIQAIKAIGKDRINEYIPKIRLKISEEEKNNLLVEGKRTTAWTYEAIKDIAKEDTNVSNS